MTIEAASVIENADLIVGYTTYVNLLKEEFPEKEYLTTPMRKEVERCRIAVEKAMEGNTVAMVSSGDSGIYGMAGVVMEVAEEMNISVNTVNTQMSRAYKFIRSRLGASFLILLSVI